MMRTRVTAFMVVARIVAITIGIMAMIVMTTTVCHRRPRTEDQGGANTDRREREFLSGLYAFHVDLLVHFPHR